jgi:hypothetical protein|uniref:Uncharacterized protein n=1 Tax=Zea mays TaxID=4577 RepID=C4IZ79_MAIZE|nr:unknown [Zea mays]
MFLHNSFEPLINFSSRMNRNRSRSKYDPILKFYSVKFGARYHPYICRIIMLTLAELRYRSTQQYRYIPSFYNMNQSGSFYLSLPWNEARHAYKKQSRECTHKATSFIPICKTMVEFFLISSRWSLIKADIWFSHYKEH